jgi:hypothetical protein
MEQVQMSTKHKKPVTGWRKIIADWLGIETVQMPEKTPVYINGGSAVRFHGVTPLPFVTEKPQQPRAPRTPRKIMTLAQRNRIQSMKTGASELRFYKLIGCGDRNAHGIESTERCIAIWSGIIAHPKWANIQRRGKTWRLVVRGKVQTDDGVRVMGIKEKQFSSYDEALAFTNAILDVHNAKVKADEWNKKYPPAATVAYSYWK